MKCQVIRGRRGGDVIVCGGRRRTPPPCYRCNRPASVQCDKVVRWEDHGITMKPITCDRWCCPSECSVGVGPNRHFCREHYDAEAREKARQVAP